MFGLMRYEIEFHEGQITDAQVTVSGEMTVEGNRTWLAALVSDPRWRPGMKILVDAHAVDPGTFAGDDVQAVADTTVSDDAIWGACRIAAIVDSPVVYGLVRMWQAFTADMELRTDVFYSRDEALAWLATSSSGRLRA